MRALIVDDSSTMRSLLRMYLKQAGFATLEAGDGQAGWEVLQQEGPLDLALVDWNMPCMNGLEFVQTVRADGRFDQMRIMMVTAQAEVEQVQRMLQSGADEYIMKPFNKDVIIDKLRMLGF
jgi:two-component system chemotaxis response regulator CheY